MGKYVYYIHTVAYALREPTTEITDNHNRTENIFSKAGSGKTNKYKNRYLLCIIANHVLAQQSYTRTRATTTIQRSV